MRKALPIDPPPNPPQWLTLLHLLYSYELHIRLLDCWQPYFRLTFNVEWRHVSVRIVVCISLISLTYVSIKWNMFVVYTYEERDRIRRQGNSSFLGWSNNFSKEKLETRRSCLNEYFFQTERRETGESHADVRKSLSSKFRDANYHAFKIILFQIKMGQKNHTDV